MYRKTVLFLLVLIFSGCGVVDFYTEDNPDSGYDTIPSYNVENCRTPFKSVKFQPVLEHTYLQYPDSQAVVSYDNFPGYQSPFFYLCNDLLYFVVEKKSKEFKVRCELREGPGTWSVSSSHAWHGRLRCFKPKEGINAYTWMQIHGNHATYNYPLLRLMWVRNYHGVNNHLWAIVIVSAPDEEKHYEWIDLGKCPKDFFDTDVEIADSRMEIFIDGREIVSRDVSYGESVQNYFKAGIYLHRKEDEGKAAVAFERLSFE